MKSYHGSSRLFDRFDLNHSGEGDGKNKFGYGVYTTDRYERAAHYSFNKHRPAEEQINHYVYTVEIPDITDDNCYRQFKDGPVSQAIVKRCEAKLGITIPQEAIDDAFNLRKYIANTLLGVNATTKKMIAQTTDAGNKLASDFLRGIGFDMIVWPIVWKDKEFSDKDYAILDDSKIRILSIDKVKLDGNHKLVPGSEQRIK